MKLFTYAALICIAVMLLIAPTSSWADGINSRYGVVSTWYAGGSPNVYNDLLQNLGCKWVRGCFDWNQIETADDVYDWFLSDAWVAGMDSLGVNIYWGFSYTPAWARSGGTYATPPTNPAKYAEFITEVVNRYKGSIKYWGFWNEPNLTTFYTGDLNGYINNLLIPGIDAVKNADPTAKVVVGELSTSGDDVSKLRTILRALVTAGKKDTVDVICHHSYDGGDTASGRLADMNTLRNMIVSEGWGDKDFWCTETGFNGNEANQATQVMGMIQGMDARPWWKKTFVYTMLEDAANGHGLIRLDNSVKPSYLQYQAYIASHSDNAEVVSDTIPTTMITGQQYTVSVTMKNVGTFNWTESQGYKLGAVGDSDPFAGGRYNLNPGEVVATDASRTFTFVMTAPATPGTYTTDWQMVHEGVCWFGGILSKQVTVNAPAVNNAQVISDTIPTTMTAGQQYTVSVTMKNIGTTTWTAAGTNAHKLGGAGDSDPFYTVNNPPRILLNAGETVAPNAQRTFTFTMTAPSTSGTYTTDWRMVQEWIEWFGGTLSKQVTVNGGPITISHSTFNVDTNSWTVSLWHAGSYTDGTMAWNSGAGNGGGGGLRTIGSGSSDNTDRCTREGGEIQRTIPTNGRSGITVTYDLRVNTLGGNYTGTGSGSCSVDHNVIDDQLTVYYSTNGGANWTEVDNVLRSTLLGSYQSYGTRTINLTGDSACNNNAHFRLRFRWQVNGTNDTVDLDNIKVIAAS